jgi:hypothetical protein
MKANRKNFFVNKSFGLLWTAALILGAALLFGGCPNPSGSETDPAAPQISVQPASAAYNLNAVPAALTVTASVSDDGVLSYQWHSNTADSVEGGTPVGGNYPYFTPPTDTLGVTWYYVEVTNTLGDKTASVTSAAAKIEVTDLIAWTAAANGSDGGETSTAITFTFNRDPGALNAAEITLANENGEATKGELSGEGLTRTLALTSVETAGNIRVSVDKAGVVAGSQTVAVYKAGEANPANYTVEQTGGAENTATTTALKFTFDKPVEGLTADDINLIGVGNDVTKGALSGGGTEWTLEITAVVLAREIIIAIDKNGIDSSRKELWVYRAAHITWTAEQIGAVEGAQSSTGIKITFSEPVEGLTLEDIKLSNTIHGSTTVIKIDELAGGGTEWILSLTLFPYRGWSFGSEVKVYDTWRNGTYVIIEKSDIVYSNTQVKLYLGPIADWTAEQIGGTSGSADSTGIKFSFNIPVNDDLKAEDISVANGTGTVTTGALSPSEDKKEWTLALTSVSAQGTVTVSLSKDRFYYTGTTQTSQTITVYSATPDIAYTAEQMGGASGSADSTGIKFSFASPVDLSAGDITITPSGSVTTGALNAGGDKREWTLALTGVAGEAEVTVSIPDKPGIEHGEKTLTVYKKPDIDLANGQTLGAYLPTITGDSEGSPHTVALAAGVNISADWAVINETVQSAEKYVILDLNACSAVDNAISGGAVPTGNNINIIKDNQYIKGIVLPNTLTTIGDYSFSSCANLTSLTIPSGVTTIGDHSFAACANLTGLTIPSGVITIGPYAFIGCGGLANLVLPTGLTSIGQSAFQGCSISSAITIPATVTTIGSSAFNGCTGSFTVTMGTSPSSSMFQNATGLTGFTLQGTVSAIGSQAFQGCTSLTGELTIPATVTTIGNSAFNGCTGLTKVTVTANQSSIGMMAFTGCTGIEEVVFEGVTSVGNNAFNSSLALAKVSFGADGTSIGNAASFPYASGTTTLKALHETTNSKAAGTYTRTRDGETGQWSAWAKQ